MATPRNIIPHLGSLNQGNKDFPETYQTCPSDYSEQPEPHMLGSLKIKTKAHLPLLLPNMT